MTKAQTLFLSLVMLFPLASWSQSSLVGAWELVHVAPTDVELADPRGIINTKMYFTANGKLTGLKPDEVVTEKTRFADYKFDGKSVTLLSEGNPPYTVGVSFPDFETMLFSPPNASQRKFKRLAGPNIEIEPRSLQLIKLPASSATSAAEVSYDTNDYSGLPVEKRIQGTWEIIAYRRVPRNQAPPYGFLNDLWEIKSDTILITRRDPKGTETQTYSWANGNILVSGAVLDRRSEAKLKWKPSFNKWGHLVLDWDNAQIVFKLVSKNINQAPNVPVKIVLLQLAGE